MRLNRIINVIAPTVFRDLGRPYAMGPVSLTPGGYTVIIYDQGRSLQARISWTAVNDLQDESSLIRFAKELLTQGIRMLDRGGDPPVQQDLYTPAWAETKEDPVYDVDFS